LPFAEPAAARRDVTDYRFTLDISAYRSPAACPVESSAASSSAVSSTSSAPTFYST
jgi:hypothetical protein